MSMQWVFLIKQLLEVVFFPPVFPLLLIFSGLVLMTRQHRRGLAVAWCGLLLALVFSTPVTVNWMAKQLESFPAVDPLKLRNAQAIIILGGGERGWAQEYGGAAPSRLTLERLRYGARLGRQTSLPILVSGGAPAGHEAEAKLMAESLRADFSLTARWIENRSLDTADNARYSSMILKNAGVWNVLLVTTASHMRRAVYEFKRTGLEVTAAPTAFFSDQPSKREIYEYLPNISSCYIGWYVAHEWGGILVQRIRDGLGFYKAGSSGY
jgi:uncharacterized SAM-binding protein YcdF (DUF218 family)